MLGSSIVVATTMPFIVATQDVFLYNRGMDGILSALSSMFVNLYGIAGLLILCFGAYWLFNKKAKQRHIAELRATLKELSPTDPEYNQVRALYTDMVIRANHWDLFYGHDLAGHSCGGDSGGHDYGSCHFSDGHGGGDGH